MTTRETELTAQVAALELEVVRLRNALEHLSKAAGQTIDVRTPEDWVNLNIGLSLSIQVMSTPFTPTALPELIEKAEKMTIERCAGVCKTLDRKEKRHAAGYGPGYLTHTASDCEQIIRALPTGQIKLEELL